MKEKKKDRKREILIITLGFIVVLVLVLYGLSRCGKDETVPDKKNEVSLEEENNVSKKPNIGETITGEEIEEEDEAIIIESSEEGKDDTHVSVDAEDLEVEDSSQNPNKGTDKTEEDSSNKKPGNAENGDADQEETPSDDPEQPGKEEEEPPKLPVKPEEDEEPGQTGDDETEGTGKWGGSWY